MLSFINNYLDNLAIGVSIDDVAQTVSDYILDPLFNLAVDQTQEIAIKSTSIAMTTLSATTLIPQIRLDAIEDKEQNAMSLNDKLMDTIQNFPKNTKYFAQGLALEQTASLALSAIESLYPTTVGKALSYVAPRATSLASTQREAHDPGKEIAIGALSHGAGTLATEYTNYMLPMAAPYGGFVAYGIANGLCTLGISKTYDLIDNTLEKALKI